MSILITAENTQNITKTLFRSSKRNWISLRIQTFNVTGEAETIDIEIHAPDERTMDRLDKQLAIGEAVRNKE